MPALIKVGERLTNIFTCQRNFKPHEIFWEKAQLVPTVVLTDPKKPHIFGAKVPDKYLKPWRSETLTRSTTKYPAFSQDPICQVWFSGLDIKLDQKVPKVEKGWIKKCLI